MSTRRLIQSSLTPMTARGWHALTFAVALCAVCLQVGLDLSTGQTAGTRLMRTVDRFSFQSNVLVLIATGVAAFRPTWQNKFWQVVRLDAVVGSLAVGLTYVVLLRPVTRSTGWDSVADNGLHYVVPVFVILGWTIFGPRDRMAGSTVLLSMIWPFLCFCWAFGYGAATGFYPYPFLDADAQDLPRAILNSLVVTIPLLVCAALVWRLDRRLSDVELLRGITPLSSPAP